nr:hypothetical protein [uncultured bacterium]
MEDIMRFAAHRAVQPPGDDLGLLVPAYGSTATSDFLSDVTAATNLREAKQLAAQQRRRAPRPPDQELGQQLEKVVASGGKKEVLDAIHRATDLTSQSWLANRSTAARAAAGDALLAATLDAGASEAERSGALRHLKLILVAEQVAAGKLPTNAEITDFLQRAIVLLPKVGVPAGAQAVVPAARTEATATVPAMAVNAGRAEFEVRRQPDPVMIVEEAHAALRELGRRASGGSTTLSTGGGNGEAAGEGSELAIARFSATMREPMDSTENVLRALRGTGVALTHIGPMPARERPTFQIVRTPRTGALVRPPGVLDLLVVRQKPVGYEHGDIAHIENVLMGETRERLHRRVETTESTVAQLEERTSEQEKETQTNTRNEMASETSAQTRIDAKAEGHVNVQASYGVAKITADASAGFSYSRETSDKNASKYAKEVTERAAAKLTERIQTQRLTRTTTQIDEMVKHTFDAREATGNVVGVYRWVDRIYECELWQYDGRLVFEFEIPEPAKYFRWFRDLERAVPGAGTPPRTLEELGLGDPTTYTAEAIPILQRELGLTGLRLPPPITQVVPFTISKPPQTAWKKPDDDTTASQDFVSVDVQIPAGYYAVSVSYQARAVGYNRNVQMKIGSQWSNVADEGAGATHPGGEDVAQDWVQDANWPGWGIPDQPTGMLKISAYSFAAGFEILGALTCLADPTVLRTWQLDLHEKALAAYAGLRNAYDARARATSTLRQQITARPAEELRRIESNELKHAVIELLEGPGTVGEQGWIGDGDGGPALRPDVARYGRTVQFLEQAFEWMNLDAVYYPYFWAPRASWPTLMAETDADPMFAQFLQAGSARVTVPVTPGFERLAQAYLAGWGVWGGGDAPGVDDPLYRGIAAEILERIDGPVDGRRVRGPWRISLPTTLVHLQEDSTLPAPPPLTPGP